jgi:hypothetical protein
MIRATVNQQHVSESNLSPDWLAHDYRQFLTGATRDTDAGKLDFDGFLSPLVLRRYAEYMHGHRKLPDGSLRASDNWALGIDREVYMKSLWRHFFAVWEENKGIETPDGLAANLCAVLFNASGMLHEFLKAQNDHTPGAGYSMPLADKED